MSQRVDSGTRRINAPATTIYRAFTDREAWIAWLPPKHMTGTIGTFDLRMGGHYEMTLRYDKAPAGGGKTSADGDTLKGRFVELVPDERVVQAVDFVSEDPAFAGTMKMTWSVARVDDETSDVTFTAEDVPSGISVEDHQKGLNESLAGLAEYVER